MNKRCKMTKPTNQTTTQNQVAEDTDNQKHTKSSGLNQDNSSTEHTQPNTLALRVTELEQKLILADSEVKQLKDQLLRTLAESENTRKRMLREKEESQKFAISNFAKDLVGVADNFDRALKNLITTEDPILKNFIEGITMTERQLMSVFEKYNLKKVVPVGERFDGHQHQAVMDVPSSTQAPGTIVDVFQAAFFLHDRLLRPAMVTVAKAALTDADDSNIETGKK